MSLRRTDPMNTYSVTILYKERRDAWFGLVLIATLALILSACGGQQSQQGTQAPTLSLPAIGGLPPAATGLQALGQLAPTARLQLSIGLATQRQTLANDLAALYDPTSPHFGKYLTPPELATRYGASQTSITTVTNYLQKQGFYIQAVSPLRNQISVSATVTQIAQTFGVRMQTFQQDGSMVFGPSETITLPPALQGLVTSVIGLNDFAFHITQASAQDTAQRLPDQQPGARCAQSNQVTWPNQLAAAYNYVQAYQAGYTGKGITIGLYADNDQGISLGDIANFLACTTGGTLHRNVVKVNGGAQNTLTGAVREAELDLEYLAALAPEAQILEYQNDFCYDTASCQAQTGKPLPEALADAINQMAADGRIQVASMSITLPEADYTQDEVFAIDQAIQYLAAEGVTFLVASGDCGAFGGGQYHGLSVDFPASDPYAVAVGGTRLATDAQGNRISETAWSDPQPDQSHCGNNWGSTGGLSQVFAQPGWQQGAGVKNSYANGKREVPDVAAIARTVPIYFQGQWYGRGGTSVAAPIWAAGVALVDQGLRQHVKQSVGATPTFYRVADQHNNGHPYFDVTQGNNLYYPATQGYDLTTGWGAPNILDFGKALGAF